MDSSAGRVERPPNPRATANPLSALTFGWVLGTFLKGYRRDLEVEDLAVPLKEHRSDLLGDIFEKYWDEELKRAARRKGARPSLARVIVRAFGVRLGLYGLILAVMEIVLRVLQPIFLGRLVLSFSDPEKVPRNAALGYAGGVVLCSAANIFVIHPYMMAILHMGMKMRVGSCSLLYRKTLRLSKVALGETTAGQVVNLLANDVARFDLAVIFLHYLWIGPVETVLATYVMYYEVGLAAIFGVATILMFIPLQAFLGKRTSTLRLGTAIRTDERVRLMNEIILGMQVIKMYTWELPFNKVVEEARRQELKYLKQNSYIRGVVLSFIMFNTRIAIFVSMLAYVFTGGEVTAEKVFLISAYYNVLRQTMTVFFPQGVTQMAEAFVSIHRIEKFLLYAEAPRFEHPVPPPAWSHEIPLAEKPAKAAAQTQPAKTGTKAKRAKAKAEAQAQPQPTPPPPFVPEPNPGVELRDASAKWTPDTAEYSLNCVSMRIEAGEHVAVVGHVGSGKTSLLHALLRELPLLAGTLEVRGSVSYASQEPWMFAGSVRQNILFGQPFDRHRYNQVLDVCALRTDLQQLPYSDKTIVGERGISLSGGQRARINLARAVYKEADIYLLDDPLSAVDTHVGKHLFEECITGHLAGKVVILITHQLQYLKHVKKIYIMENGAIQQQGTYSELQKAGTDFSEVMKSGSTDDDDAKTKEHSATPLRTSRASVTSVDDKNVTAPVEEGESRSRGTVAADVYLRYFAAGGNWCVIAIMFLLCLVSQGAASGADYWITYWTNAEEMRTNRTLHNATVVDDGIWTEDGMLSRDMCIYIYAAITAAVVILSLIRSVVFFSVCIRASQRLHDAMFYCVTRAKMRFFNTNTSGRILNRFSKDMGAVDEILPQCMVDTLQIGLALCGIIIVLAVVNYWFLIPTAVIGILFYLMRLFYLATSRSVKRLEGIARSPVFSHLNASLQGLTTIRAFGAEDILIKEFDGHQDLHSSAWYVFIATSRAFGFWLDIICVAFITIVTFSFLMVTTDAFGGNVGLAVTQAIALTGMFQWGMRQSAEMENQMTSVERILEYKNVEQEHSLESVPGKKPPPDWPQEGRVVFSHVHLKYNPTEAPVLKDLSFTVHHGEKVGIVGRTGAGKSSLISALFRLAEIEGLIELDGIDTGSIGLHDLRRKISIIPQEPVLFTGTLRKNLDPFDEFSDAALLRALEEVELGDVIHDMVAGLSTKVSEGGSNFSVGQRQLVCLARAILRDNKVLVLDEATANVDPQTDAFIQTTIRKKFAACTVLTIAHRLHTIMDSDRVLVMDGGSMVEFGSPHDLLQNAHGHFYQMVQRTGRGMAEQLTKIADAGQKRTPNA